MNKADDAEYAIQDEHIIRELEELNDEQNEKKATMLSEMRKLQEKIDKENANTVVQRLLPLLELLKDSERKESDFHSRRKAKQAKLQAEITELENKLLGGDVSSNTYVAFEDSLINSTEKLNSAKTGLAAKRRDILSLKRTLDDMASQTELIQYERRFAELEVNIQEKHRRTRKYYATYNALLEIKDLMLKETSLLNSISSQFQDAITSAAGRTKLIESMEGIVKGIQQKLEKVQVGFYSDQKLSETLKEKYAAALAEQRRCYSLLKSFQEECARNEKLRSQTSD